MASAAALAASTLMIAPSAAAATQVQVYGAWLCGTDECTWASAPNMTTFDTDNHWLIDRGDGIPSVNLVVLAFVNPLKLLDQTTDSGDVKGVPAGMTSTVVDYYTSRGVRVMLSVGGVTYTGDWDTALSANPAQLGLNAAAVASAGAHDRAAAELRFRPRLPTGSPVSCAHVQAGGELTHDLRR